MSIWNKLFAPLAVAALFAAPALADGTPGKRVNRGPAPVVAHQPTPPEPGCYLIEGGKAWSCPARPTQHAPKHVQKVHKHSAQQPAHQPCCGTHTRTVVREHAPVVTKRTVTHRSAPVTRRTVQQPTRTVRTVKRSAQRATRSSDVQLDLASFSGGVGSGVDGGFYGGGGGAVTIGSSRSFSGVLSHSASSFTFRSRGGGKKRRRGGGCNSCMGGGMGGGD